LFRKLIGLKENMKRKDLLLFSLDLRYENQTKKGMEKLNSNKLTRYLMKWTKKKKENYYLYLVLVN